MSSVTSVRPISGYSPSATGRPRPSHSRSNGSSSSWFETIVISGDVKARKPHPAIFEHVIEQFDVQPSSTVFIDDTDANVEAARTLGFLALRFVDAQALRRGLNELGVLRG